MDPATLNEAITVYLGYGSESFPDLNRRRLADRFGDDTASKLVPILDGLLDELGAIHVDWKQHSLQSAGDMAARAMKERHPELSDAALKALDWKFTFDWR